MCYDAPHNNENGCRKMNRFISAAFVCALMYSGLVFAEPKVSNVSSDRPEQWAVLVSAENNLYKVSDTLYRSEQLVKRDLGLVNSLDIKTIVNLRPSNKDKKEFFNTNITLIDVPMRAWSVKDEQIAEALWQIEEGQKKGSVLLHCYHGSDRTGLVVGMYRIIYQNWEIEDAYEEMRKGEYGFNTIWTNIPPMFSVAHVENIKKILEKKRDERKVIACQ